VVSASATLTAANRIPLAFMEGPFSALWWHSAYY
jgi:hypothetical protein